MCVCAYGIGAQGFVQVIHGLVLSALSVLWSRSSCGLFGFFARKVCRLSNIGLACFCWWFCGGLHKNFLNDFDTHTQPPGAP